MCYGGIQEGLAVNYFFKVTTTLKTMEERIYNWVDTSDKGVHARKDSTRDHAKIQVWNSKITQPESILFSKGDIPKKLENDSHMAKSESLILV